MARKKKSDGGADVADSRDATAAGSVGTNVNGFSCERPQPKKQQQGAVGKGLKSNGNDGQAEDGGNQVTNRPTSIAKVVCETENADIKGDAVKLDATRNANQAESSGMSAAQKKNLKRKLRKQAERERKEKEETLVGTRLPENSRESIRRQKMEEINTRFSAIPDLSKSKGDSLVRQQSVIKKSIDELMAYIIEVLAEETRHTVKPIGKRTPGEIESDISRMKVEIDQMERKKQGSSGKGGGGSNNESGGVGEEETLENLKEYLSFLYEQRRTAYEFHSYRSFQSELTSIRNELEHRLKNDTRAIAQARDESKQKAWLERIVKMKRSNGLPQAEAQALLGRPLGGEQSVKGEKVVKGGSQVPSSPAKVSVIVMDLPAEAFSCLYWPLNLARRTEKSFECLLERGNSLTGVGNSSSASIKIGNNDMNNGIGTSGGSGSINITSNTLSIIGLSQDAAECATFLRSVEWNEKHRVEVDDERKIRRLIGPGGSHLKKIEKNFFVLVQIEGMEVMVLGGKSNIEKAVAAIQENLSEALTAHPSGGKSERGTPTPPSTPPMDLRICSAVARHLVTVYLSQVQTVEKEMSVTVRVNYPNNASGEDDGRRDEARVLIKGSDSTNIGNAKDKLKALISTIVVFSVAADSNTATQFFRRTENLPSHIQENKEITMVRGINSLSIVAAQGLLTDEVKTEVTNLIEKLAPPPIMHSISPEQLSVFTKVRRLAIERETGALMRVIRKRMGDRGGSGKGRRGGGNWTSSHEASSQAQGQTEVIQIEICGKKAQAEAAQAKLVELMDLYGHFKTIDVTRHIITMLLEKQGSRIRGLEANLGVSIAIQKSKQSVAVSGSSSSVTTACEQIMELDNASYQDDSGDSNGDDGNGGDGVISLMVPIKKSDIGLVVGKGGSTIKRISNDSGGAQLTIVTQNDHTESVRIRGTPSSVDAAESLILEVIASAANNYSGGSSPSGVAKGGAEDTGVAEGGRADGRSRGVNGHALNGHHSEGSSRGVKQKQLRSPATYQCDVGDVALFPSLADGAANPGAGSRQSRRGRGGKGRGGVRRGNSDGCNGDFEELKNPKLHGGMDDGSCDDADGSAHAASNGGESAALVGGVKATPVTPAAVVGNGEARGLDDASPDVTPTSA